MTDKPWEEYRNKNVIHTKGFSNKASEKIYNTIISLKDEGKHSSDDARKLHHLWYHGYQCFCCSFYAEFNADWGLCCYCKSQHHLETVFEHFTCLSYQHEGANGHTFTEKLIPSLQSLLTTFSSK